MGAISDTNAIGKMPPPKVSIRSIPKLAVPGPIRREFGESTLQMTETGLFVVRDPSRLLPEELAPEGDFRCLYIETG